MSDEFEKRRAAARTRAAARKQREAIESAGKSGEISQMSEIPDLLNRLRNAHRELQDAMGALTEKKEYSAAEQHLFVVNKLMVDLIEAAGGMVVRR